MKQVQVVAAIIKEKNRYLIVQRNKNKHLGLKWEFPGGKVGFNENFKKALTREIKEELNIIIEVKEKIAEEAYKDHKIDIHLHYFFCKHIANTIKFTEHESMVWVEKKDFFQYDFAEGDGNILSLL